MMFVMLVNFQSWSAWEETGRKGCTVSAAAAQLGTSRAVILKLLKAGRLDEVRIYEAGKHIATLVRC
jgi:hypothetical protein